MKVLVGLSGGVDSTVCALLLKQQGYDVIGATMSIWGTGNSEIDNVSCQTNKQKNACYGPNEKKDIEEAKKIAQSIGVKHYVVDCVDLYKKIVLDDFKSEYLKGCTPNPCVRCNSLIKFGALPKGAKAMGIEFDKFATGHYARIEKENDRYILKRAVNSKKDQSYFLYRLTQEQLKNIIFPLGSYTKDEIREIAKQNGLDVAQKPDSQDFYDGDYNELLKIENKKGNIVDLKGNILAQHNGIWNYTIGQRKGLGFSASEPMYVLELNKEKNEVVVGPLAETFKTSLYARELNWIYFEKNPKTPFKAQAKIRSTQTPTEVTVTPLENEKVFVEFECAQKSIAPGQSVVFYNDDIVLGGGIIE